MKWSFNTCGRYETDLSLLAAEALEREKEGDVRAHLEKCAACQAKYAELSMLATTLSRQGSELPNARPSAKLRRQWTSAVREPAPVPERTGCLDLISGRKLAWGGIGAMWALILLLRLTTPEGPRQAAVAVAPVSIHDVLLVLKVDPREAQSPSVEPKNQKPKPERIAPHSQNKHRSLSHENTQHQV